MAERMNEIKGNCEAALTKSKEGTPRYELRSHFTKSDSIWHCFLVHRRGKWALGVKSEGFTRQYNLIATNGMVKRAGTMKLNTNMIRCFTFTSDKIFIGMGDG